jgi:hypothetical protein
MDLFGVWVKTKKVVWLLVILKEEKNLFKFHFLETKELLMLHVEINLQS